MTRDGRDKLDGLIDEALARCASCEPLEGLEQRVLNRIRAACAPRRSVWRHRVGFAVAALAALLLVVRIAWTPQPQIQRTEAPKLADVTPAVPKPAAPRAGTRRPGSRAVRGPRGASTLPRRERFPMPVPMTPEEHALMAWVRHAPAEARQTLVDLQRRGEEPVLISRIQIEPLQNDGAQ